jgi:hypothetical protein
MSALSKVEMSVSTPFWEFGGFHFDGHGGDEHLTASMAALSQSLQNHLPVLQARLPKQGIETWLRRK